MRFFNEPEISDSRPLAYYHGLKGIITIIIMIMIVSSLTVHSGPSPTNR